MGDVTEQDFLKNTGEDGSASEECEAPRGGSKDEGNNRTPDSPDAGLDPGGETPRTDSDGDDLETQHRDLTDRHLRLAAEFDNYRKRTAREWTQRVQGATADLLLDLLEIADNFDRALQVEHAEGAYAEGVRMIFQQLQGLLRRRGVAAMEPLGQAFDPTQHEALLHVASLDYAEGQVCQEIRRGYTLHDRVLRPAQVAVSNGAKVPEQQDANEEK